MRKLISMTVLSFALLMGTAHAFEGVLLPGQNGELKIQPLKRDCGDIPQPAVSGDKDIQSVCNPGTTSECPEHFQKTSKFCWGGWHHGFYKCGYACRPIQRDCLRGYNHPDCWTGGEGH